MITWETLSKELIDRFPAIAGEIAEAEDASEPEGLGVDPLLADIFTPYVISLVANGGIGVPEIASAFNTIEELVNSDDRLLVSMAVLSILETLEQDQLSLAKAKQFMGPSTLEKLPTPDWFLRNPGDPNVPFRARAYVRGS